jgi:Ca-activated chloride channel family protein
MTTVVLLAIVAALTAWLWPHLARPPTRFEVARQLLQQGRPADAAQLLEDPLWRGVAEYRAGRYQSAVADFNGEQSILALYDLGTAYAQLQDWSTAASVLEQVLRLDPNHADARHNLDIVLQAIELTRNASAGNPQQQPSSEQGNAEQNEAQNSQDNPSQNQPDNGAGEASTAKAEKDKKSDNSEVAGELSDEQPTPQPATAVASGEPPEGGDESERRINQSTLLETRESTQAAEILLRQIRDNPAKVLRARLHIAHRERRAVDQP